MENIPFRPPENRVVARRVAAAAREVDHFQAMTERAPNYLHTVGVPDERIAVLPLGIDMERFAPADGPRADQAGAHAHGVSSGAGQGRRGPRDRGGAAGGARGRDELTLMGDGPLKPRLEWIAGEMGIADRVKLPGGGPWSELHTVYRAHDVFVLASAATRIWREQFGFALIEAMGCGLRCWSATRAR